MDSFRIVKGVDVLKDAELCFLKIGKRAMVGPLVFQRPEESFHDSVVVAASGVAHGARDAKHLKCVLIQVARVLATSVAVMKKVCRVRSSSFNGISQCATYQRRGQAVADCPADDLTTK